jgi:hypothetical protein
MAAATAEAAAPAYTSDSLVLYFKAEGTMEERAIPKITESLQVWLRSFSSYFTANHHFPANLFAELKY